MPYYQFECRNCGDVRDVKRSMAEAGKPGVCERCKTATHRTYKDQTNFAFRPSGYHLKPGDKGYDSNFEVRNGRQWETSLRSRQLAYEGRLTTGEGND